MSYEGRVQFMCSKGHYNEIEEPYDTDYVFKCHCGLMSEWINLINDTNCDWIGEIHERHLTINTPEKFEVCNLGHRHVIEAETYKIPTEEETEKLRTYYDYNKDKWFWCHDNSEVKD